MRVLAVLGIFAVVTAVDAAVVFGSFGAPLPAQFERKIVAAVVGRIGTS